jgi:hypothetical protein
MDNRDGTFSTKNLDYSMKDCIFANVMVNNSNIPTGSSLRVVMAI